MSGNNIKTHSRHNHYVTSVYYSSDGKRIVSGSRDNTIKIWDA
jgi:WD40 repeat protein